MSLSFLGIAGQSELDANEISIEDGNLARCRDDRADYLKPPARCCDCKRRLAPHGEEAVEAGICPRCAFSL